MTRQRPQTTSTCSDDRVALQVFVVRVPTTTTIHARSPSFAAAWVVET